MLDWQARNIRNIENIVGPFEVVNANPKSPDQGGTLDRGIVAHLEDGSKLVIGEIWAACPYLNGRKVSIDTDDIASRIVDALNAAEGVAS